MGILLGYLNVQARCFDKTEGDKYTNAMTSQYFLNLRREYKASWLYDLPLMHLFFRPWLVIIVSTTSNRTRESPIKSSRPYVD
jgi:hypothetical protein